MAPISWSDVTTQPGLASLTSVDPIAQNVILAYVNDALSVTLVGGSLGEESPKLKLARIYMAAHLGLLTPRAGIVSSEGEGDLSIAYSLPPMPPGGDPFWQRTSYGAAFQMLIRTTGAILPTVA